MLMQSSAVERITAARLFAQRWADRGYEKGDTHSFWLDLLSDVLGMSDASTVCRFEQRTNKGGFIDVVIAEAKTIVEQKSAGVDLDKKELRQGVEVTPYEQAKAYADTLPNLQRPDYIIVCNFTTFRVHDLNAANPEKDFIEFTLAEFSERPAYLEFLVDPKQSLAKKQEQVSIAAGEQIGRLHDAIEKQYVDADSEQARHSLNVLCVRLVFCLFAEDSGVFQDGQFFRFLRRFTEPHLFRRALIDLFEALDTPPADRDAYADPALLAFPYVNGGLFRERIEIPVFDEPTIGLLLDEVAEKTDWSVISPTIFGGVFESTLNPEVRRSGGMHYTSPENIHRAIDPLFLDDLTQELERIVADRSVQDRTRRERLQRFQAKLGSLHFFDPAAGSGNFLTETYICLRRLENKVLSELNRDQTALDFEGATQLKVSVDQMHGIEINEFAVHVARTALWIAELQANAETASIVQRVVDDLPLRDGAHIVQGNALRMNWANIAPPQCSYIIGNPPFIGYSNHSAEQKQDRADIFGKSGGVLDYVAGWYKKAADYMEGTTIQAALVSTNSICQGQQVAPLWKPLFDRGVVINFAHTTFPWGNEASDQAHVHVIIVGFSYVEREPKRLFIYDRSSLRDAATVPHINAYLAPARDAFVERRTKPLCAVPEMAKGFQATDGGHLLLNADEAAELVRIEPDAKPWVRKFSMGAEFIKGIDRYCLWLPDITPADFKRLPHLRARVEACRVWRLEQTPTGDAYKLADRPHLLRPTKKFRDGTYIGVPSVSSERRKYIPIGFVDDGMIPGNMLYFVPTDCLYVFGLLMSQFHNAWMRTVAGRLKSDYRNANTIVYNNFVWPGVATPSDLTVSVDQLVPTDIRQEIEDCAQSILDARREYAGATLADLYDPNNDWLYPALTKAHQELDSAVERAYGVDFGGDETKIVAHLFDLYAQVTTP